MSSTFDNICANAVQMSLQNGWYALASALVESGNFSPTTSNGEIYLHSNFKKVLSPFCTALLCDIPNVAKYMLKAFYLTLSDLGLHADVALRHRLFQKPRCLDILKEMGSSPPSLKMLSFVHVSDRLGPGLARREKVTQLGLPPLLQRSFLFTHANQRIGKDLHNLDESYGGIYDELCDSDENYHSD